MRLLAALLIVPAVAAGAPAQAQRAVERVTGSNIPIPKRGKIPEGRPFSDADRARIAIAGVARCMVDRQPEKVGAALGMPLGRDYNKALQGLAREDCLQAGEVGGKTIVFRGALFTELWRRRSIAESTGKNWGPVLPSYDPDAPVGDADDQTKQQMGLLWFADCVVKRDPVAASDVVVRQIASKEQNEAYTRLVPNLGPCLLEGQQLKFSKPVIEGALAEVLYRAPAAPKIVSGVQ